MALQHDTYKNKSAIPRARQKIYLDQPLSELGGCHKFAGDSVIFLLVLVLVLVLLRAATSPRQFASSPRHGPMATKNPRPTAELRSHLNQSPAVLLVRPQHAARASLVAVVLLRSARREKIRGRRPDPVNELGRAGVGSRARAHNAEPATSEAKASSERGQVF